MAAVAHLAAHPDLPAPDAADLLHARRGDRRGRDAVRRRGASAPSAPTRSTAPTSASCRTRRSPAEEVSLTITGVDAHPGLGEGRPRQRRAAGRQDRRRAAGRPDARAHRRPRRLHPRLRDRRDRRARGGARDRARLRRRQARRAHRAAAAHRRGGRRARAGRAARRSPSRRSTRTCTASSRPSRRRPSARRRRCASEGLEPIRTPIRGGTDGSRLSAMGLPTPNLFTGGHDYHSRREWASLQEMAAAAATVVRLAEEWARDGAPLPR